MKNVLDCRAALLFSKLLRKDKQNAVESFTDLKFKARVWETTSSDSAGCWVTQKGHFECEATIFNSDSSFSFHFIHTFGI